MGAGPEEVLDDAVRFDDLYELACWLSTARVYIGNDSGITHLAAAVGVPVVAIFLTTDPAIWAPRGPRVIVLRNPTVDDVIDAAVRPFAANTRIASSTALSPIRACRLPRCFAARHWHGVEARDIAGGPKVDHRVHHLGFAASSPISRGFLFTARYMS